MHFGSENICVMCLTYFLDLTQYCKAGNFRYLVTEP